MRSWSRLRAAVAAAVLVTVVAGIPPVRADEVDDQRRRVEQIADELDALDNQLGELEEAHAAALDRIDQLAIEIQDAQVRVDAQSAELSTLQGQLADIAIDKFMSGGSSGLTPLFSSAEGFTDDLERSELARVALDQGAGTSDEMQVLVEQFTEDKAALDAKKNEQAQLVASLEAQQQQGEALTIELQQKYAAAQTELGQAIVEEQERRAAAAAAAAQARFAAAAAAQQQAAASSNARGGGGTTTPATGGTTGGTTAPSGGSAGAPAAAPPPAVSVPAPSSTAGIATGAAQGQLGVPYKFAASSPGVAFDCSGLTKYAWGKAGVYLPHQSAAQYASTPHVPKDQAQPGDLIFYYSPIGHVALYLGGGMMIHAPATGDVVKIVAVNWGKVVGVSRPG
ncbi:MAG: NlpC/P60 family protein [Actinobacteria bacterium]|nr:NlpC/P60 family protein [Actinomycetota bacterium]